MVIEVHDRAVIEQSFPYVEAMRTCVQDPVHHAEGDVWTHVNMIFDVLDSDALQSDDRALRLTALYHDVAKPATRLVEYDEAQGREVVRHPNHTRLGAAMAWYDLWLAEEPLNIRLAVYNLCRWHQRVFHIWKTDDMVRAVLSYASIADWPQLIQFARADNAGRICANPKQASDNLELLAMLMDDPTWIPGGRAVNDGWFFQTDHDRMFYFEKENRSPWYRAQEPEGSRVIILSGLPGVGKDTHAKTRLEGVPMVSLDAIREQLKVDPTDNQGQVIQAAFEQARVYLRDQKPFIWNAQCVTRLARDKIIRLCRNYDAHVSIHAFDRPLPVIVEQMRQRTRKVPLPVVLSAAKKWEPPSLLEAHVLEWV
jgi:predicted kinase